MLYINDTECGELFTVDCTMKELVQHASESLKEQDEDAVFTWDEFCYDSGWTVFDDSHIDLKTLDDIF